MGAAGEPIEKVAWQTVQISGAQGWAAMGPAGSWSPRLRKGTSGERSFAKAGLDAAGMHLFDAKS